MTTTTNYNLLLPEGTDLVNYLTDTNPNFTALDSIIKGVSDKTITPATEVTVGTAHAITRSLADCPVMRFTATSNWTTGDTITVDGSVVTALKTDGTTLKSGDYIIGSEVIAVLQSTRLTVFVSSAAPVNASDIVYDNTNVQDALDEITKHSIGTPVTIWDGTGVAPSQFICPSDGYIWANVQNDKYTRMRINGQMPFNFARYTGMAAVNPPVYVRKDMIINDFASNDTSGSTTLMFFAIV